MLQDLEHLRQEVAERTAGLSRDELNAWLQRIRRDKARAQMELQRLQIVREILLAAWNALPPSDPQPPADP